MQYGLTALVKESHIYLMEDVADIVAHMQARRLKLEQWKEELDLDGPAKAAIVRDYTG